EPGADQSTIHRRWQPLADGIGRDRRSPLDRGVGNIRYIAAGDPKGAPFPHPRPGLAKGPAVPRQMDGSARLRTWQAERAHEITRNHRIETGTNRKPYTNGLLLRRTALLSRLIPIRNLLNPTAFLSRLAKLRFSEFPSEVNPLWSDPQGATLDH